jgi:hypothetical protein
MSSTFENLFFFDIPHISLFSLPVLVLHGSLAPTPRLVLKLLLDFFFLLLFLTVLTPLIPFFFFFLQPDGRIAPRSGLASKHFIDTGAGVIDADYRGPVRVLLFNHSDVDFQSKPPIPAQHASHLSLLFPSLLVFFSNPYISFFLFPFRFWRFSRNNLKKGNAVFLWLVCVCVCVCVCSIIIRSLGLVFKNLLVKQGDRVAQLILERVSIYLYIYQLLSLILCPSSPLRLLKFIFG